VDADPVGGTLVFTQEGATVVAEAGERRDARSGAAEAGTGGPAGDAPSILNLPATAPPKKRDGDGGGERLN
jgi:hypothetical protein